MSAHPPSPGCEFCGRCAIVEHHHTAGVQRSESLRQPIPRRDLSGNKQPFSVRLTHQSIEFFDDRRMLRYQDRNCGELTSTGAFSDPQLKPLLTMVLVKVESQIVQEFVGQHDPNRNGSTGPVAEETSNGCSRC